MFGKRALTFFLVLCLQAPVIASDEDLEEFGDIMQFALPLAGFASTYIADDPEGRKQFWKSFATSLGTTTVLKGYFGKLRPNGSSRTSYPSGHTTAAFQGAGFIDMRYGHKWGIPAYILAGITGYSRVVSDWHFADDVLAGASIGLMGNWMWVTPYKQDAIVTPVVMGDGIGVAVSVADIDGLTNKRISSNYTPKARYELAMGSAYLQKNYITAPTDTGTTFNLADFELIDDPTIHTVGTIDWYIAPRHTLHFSLAPFESRDNGQFSTPVSFGGSLFPSNTPLNSAWRMTDLTALYTYNLIPKGKWDLNIGAALSVTRTVIELSTQDQTVSAKVEDLVALPLAYLGIKYNFNSQWQVSAQARGIDLSEDNYFVTDTGVKYRINKRWDAGLYVGTYARDIKTSDLRNDIRYDLVYVTAGYSFY